MYHRIRHKNQTFTRFLSLIMMIVLLCSSLLYPVHAEEQLPFGIDVSYHQGEIDFQTVKANGVDFIIIRDGWGEDGFDPRLTPYADAALAAGIDVVGVYHFIYASNIDEVIQNADRAIANVQAAGLPKSTIIWCDLEYDTVDNARDYRDTILSAEDQRNFVIAFCNRILEAGYPTGVYLNYDFFVRVYGSAILELYDIWFADWSNAYYTRFPCVYQQTSGYGRLAGVPAIVDFDVYRGFYPVGTALPTIVKGDVNDDGVIDIDDAVLVLRYASKLVYKINKYNADVNEDGVVDTDDAVLILRYAVGLMTEFPTPAS